MLRKTILLASLLAVLMGATGLRMWLGVSAWGLCAALLLAAEDTSAAAIGVWGSAVVALLILS